MLAVGAAEAARIVGSADYYTRLDADYFVAVGRSKTPCSYRQ